ncbi:glycine cleavage system protein GcvH [Nocardia panacis]|uniref:Glycine cleavage system H protein n=1 Tax=Nocardia panacis TaxID=2340916 RepID=A0A3A4KDH5_9NOCA|nr:glycine cleavage system protein GcvH [Nocardia panacis]
MTIPAHLRYTVDHEWLALDGDTATIGVTAHAAAALGDIVHIQLPTVGDRVTAETPCGEIESTKSVSDLFAPATGAVTAVNPDAVANPELLNTDPYGAGWLLRIRVEHLAEVLDAAAYAAHIGEHQ